MSEFCGEPHQLEHLLHPVFEPPGHGTALKERKWWLFALALFTVSWWNFDYSGTGIQLMLIFYLCRNHPDLGAALYLPELSPGPVERLAGGPPVPDGGQPDHRLVLLRHPGRAADLLPLPAPGMKINKWFFYAFYPAHLAVIALVQNHPVNRERNDNYADSERPAQILSGGQDHLRGPEGRVPAGGEGRVRGRHGPLRLRQDHPLKLHLLLHPLGQPAASPLGDTELARLDEDALAQVRNRQLGFVFQDFLLLDGLTVRENILLPAIIGGTVSAMTEARADQLCDVFGISAIRDKYPAEISGGEKQRTAVARALINHPLLILADEPTGNLDSKSSRAVIRSFEQAKDALEATIFMVTHDSFAASFCDRVVILRDGVVWQDPGEGRHWSAALSRISCWTPSGTWARSETMKTFSQVYAALRRKNKGQYALLAGCCFFSVLLITAYVCMMRSPTILSVLPEGGDSRKQVMMVFVLAVIGCAVFTTYAAGLFFRQKSRETGVFLALGASRRQLQAETGQGTGRDLPGLLRRRGHFGRPSGLGAVAAVPAVPGGLPGDGPRL